MAVLHKFRVWNGKKMHQPADNFVMDGGGHLWHMHLGGNTRAKGCEVMSYAGYTDAEGTEVYEDDILDWRGKEHYRVVFKDGCFVFETDAIPAEIAPEMIRESRVVGNVYEDPGLLEETA